MVSFKQVQDLYKQIRKRFPTYPSDCMSDVEGNKRKVGKIFREELLKRGWLDQEGYARNKSLDISE